MAENYIIRGGAEGRARLSVLADAMAPFTNAFLDSAAIPEGSRVLDAGCGGGDVTRELARRVGPDGRVVGADIDAVKIAIARDDAAGLANIEFIQADMLGAGIDGAFDAIYTRFLLSHLTDPGRAVSRLLDLLEPGGMLLIEDVDFPGHFCHPPRPSFERYVSRYQDAARKRGADACLGSKLPGLLRDLGLARIDARVVTPAAFDGPIKQMAALTLEAIAESLVSEKIATREEIDADIADLKAAAADQRVFMSMPRIVQIRALKG